MKFFDTDFQTSEKTNIVIDHIPNRSYGTILGPTRCIFNATVT